MTINKSFLLFFFFFQSLAELVLTTLLTHNVGGQFDEEDSDAAQRQRHAHGDVDQIWSQLRNVFG